MRGDNNLAEKRNDHDFDNVLLEAIDDALVSLGESVKTAVYFYLEKSFHLAREEIPERISEFSAALEQIFRIGALNLELLFMRNLHAKINLVCEWPSWSKWVVSDVTFPAYVNLMKQKFEEENASKMEIEVMARASKEQEQYI
jgi:hypothetical protein